jgi:hypothetical protein
MRLWSVHPQYLDTKGLLALWREGLLALAVLRGKTRGYKNHPQLVRFRAQPDPVAAIQCFLLSVHEEACARGYQFEKARLGRLRPHLSATPRIRVTCGQMNFEANHLLRKLKLRSPKLAKRLPVGEVTTHTMFVVVEGDIEPWERV